MGLHVTPWQDCLDWTSRKAHLVPYFECENVISTWNPIWVVPNKDNIPKFNYHDIIHIHNKSSVGLTLFCEIFHYPFQMWIIFHKMLPVPHNIVMNLNNDMNWGHTNCTLHHNNKIHTTNIYLEKPVWGNLVSRHKWRNVIATWEHTCRVISNETTTRGTFTKVF